MNKPFLGPAEWRVYLKLLDTGAESSRELEGYLPETPLTKLRGLITQLTDKGFIDASEPLARGGRMRRLVPLISRSALVYDYLSSLQALQLGAPFLEELRSLAGVLRQGLPMPPSSNTPLAPSEARIYFALLGLPLDRTPDLAKHLDIHKTTIHTFINRLEAKGYVTKFTVSHTGRKTVTQIVPKVPLNAFLKEHARAALLPLSDSPPTIALMTDTLNTWLSTLSPLRFPREEASSKSTA